MLVAGIFLISLYEIKNYSNIKSLLKWGEARFLPYTNELLAIRYPHAQASHVISKIRFGVWGLAPF
jgi:hypothetical protein